MPFLFLLLFWAVTHSHAIPIPVCNNTDGTRRNFNGQCRCGSSENNPNNILAEENCNVETTPYNKIMAAQQYCIANEYPIKCYDDLKAHVENSNVVLMNNQTCHDSGLQTMTGMSPKICSIDDPCQCSFQGPRCAMDDRLPNNNSCACGNSVCNRQLGLMCHRDGEHSSCSFSEKCQHVAGKILNSNICTCGTIECDHHSGLYCRDQERFGLPRLTHACSPIQKPQICKHRRGSRSNSQSCECGTSTCSKYTGLRCIADESLCLKSECSIQAIEAMNTTKMCETFSPRCMCTHCITGFFGSDCEACPKDSTLGMVVDVLVFFVGVYCITGLLYYVFRPTNKKFKSNALTAKRQSQQLAKISKVGSSMMSVIIGQTQIISVVIGTISWSPGFPKWVLDGLDALGNVFRYRVFLHVV